MSVNGSIIKAPLREEDPYVVMGLAPSNNGYHIDYACMNTHGRINKWCKNKPMRSSIVTELSNDDKRILSYGIAPPLARSTPEATKSDSYVYQPPRGLPDSTHEHEENFRYCDFENYDQSCIAPCVCNGDQEFNLMFQPGVTVTTDDDTPASEYNILLNDFTFLNNYYLAVVLTWTDTYGNHKMYKTSETTIGNGATDIIITNDEIPNKTNNIIYNYYMCAVSVRQTKLDSISTTANWYLLPCSDVSYLQGKIKVTFTFPIDMIEKTIGNNANMVGNNVVPAMVNIDRYQDDNIESPTIYDFFGVSRYGTYLQIGYTFKNNTNKEVTLFANKFMTDFSETFASNKPVENRYLKGMYVPAGGGTYTEVNQITIPASGQKEVVLYFDILALKTDSNGNSVAIAGGIQLSNFVISFKYNGYKTFVGTTVRLRSI